MFNLFKKADSSGQAIATEQKADLRGKSTLEIIEEIHESFFTEVDKLLAEAKISKSLDTDKGELIEKCNRLKALGFTSSKEVMEAEAELNRLGALERENKAKENLIEAINYFSFKYPNYKFITEESVKKICEKYGLVYGRINDYTGTVPDENLAQMEKFKIDENDELYYSETVHRGFRGRETRFHGEYMSKERHAINYPTTKLSEGMREYIPINLSTIEIHGVAPLEIAAPVKDFNMEDKEVKDFKVSKIEIPDPVVLKPVIFKDKKFYLIVTAWGIESSDPDVVNEKMN